MAGKAGFDRSELIGALRESMNIEDDRPTMKDVTFVGETKSIVVNQNNADYTTIEESDRIAKEKADEAFKLSEEEIFAKLLQQKRN